MAQVLRILSLAAMSLCMCAAQGATVEGTIVNSVTGKGVAGVAVEMTSSKAASLKYRTETGPSGEFRFLEVSAGEHTFSYDKEGFDPKGEPQSTIWVATQGIVQIRKELDPLTILTGRVLDEENHGMRRVNVELLSGRGQIRLTVSTDDAGAFQVAHLHPGAYFLRATPNRQTASVQAHTVRAPAYHPGVASLAEASVIRVNGEARMDGYDIRVRSLPSFAIRGRVVGPAGDPMGSAPVKLKSADSYYMFYGEPGDEQVSTRSDGSFEFPAVTPGEWRLLAEASSKRMGFVAVHMLRSDLDNVTVRLSMPFTLELAVEGLPLDDSARRGPAVHLTPVEGPMEQEVQSNGPKNGRIRVDGVYPGRYRISEGARAGYYLDSILLGERNVLGLDFELTEGAPPIRLVYKESGGRVRGTVEEGGGATVVLAPELGSPDHWQSAKIDPQGRFEVGDLRPGNYFAIAVRQVEALQDPGFVEIVEREGKRLHVDARETVSAELRVTAWPL